MNFRPLVLGRDCTDDQYCQLYDIQRCTRIARNERRLELTDALNSEKVRGQPEMCGKEARQVDSKDETDVNQIVDSRIYNIRLVLLTRWQGIRLSAIKFGSSRKNNKRRTNFHYIMVRICCTPY